MTETAAALPASPALRLKTPRGRWTVAATVLGSGMAALDATVVGIALPAIGRDFHTGIADLQWVVNAYTLTLAGLLLLGGTLGDSYGRRKVFVIGIVWFAVASLLCGIAPNVGVLIAARALQGVVAAISARHVPETKAPGPVPKLDIRGAACISGALAGITYGLIALSANSWGSVSVLLPLAVGLGLLGLFIWVEAREPEPMLPLGIFKSRQFSAANAVTFVVYAALGGLLFLVPTVLQVVHGYSPIAAGSALLPVTFIMLVLSSRSGALAARIGPRLQMTVGPLVVATSLALFTLISGSGDYLTAVLPGAVVFGFGVAIMVAPLTATALSSAPAEHAGVASAVNNDVARVGQLIAVAVLPALAGITGDSYLHPAQLAHGFRMAAWISAAFCAAGGVLAGLTIRNPSRTKCAETTPQGFNCSLEAPPLRSLEPTTQTEEAR